jgi:polar amino acid transport system ATP-binding protein
MAFARDVAKRVVFMDEGQIQVAGPPAEIFDRSHNVRLDSFLSRFTAFHRRHPHAPPPQGA